MNALNTKQLRNLRITGTLQMSNEMGIISIVSSCGKEIVFSNNAQRTIVAMKLIRIGLTFGHFEYSKTEEFEGLCQSAQLNFKNFDCTILSR